MKITVLGATQSLLKNEDGRQDNLYEFGAKVMATCISNTPVDKMQTESLEKTLSRKDETLVQKHHSGYEFPRITLCFEDTSKLFITYLHNLHVYDSEGTSGRHLQLTISPKEKEVFDYFYKAFYDRTKEKYPNKPERQIKQVAVENARYIIGIDAKTNLTHQVSLRQFNYIYNWAEKFTQKGNYNEYELAVLPEMKEFCEIAKNLTLNDELIINPLLQNDPYNRQFNLFGDGKIRPEKFGTTYEIYYKSTLPTFDQLQRHRGIDYQISIPDNVEYYIPKIVKELQIEDDWVDKIESIGNISQARYLNVFECGNVDRFVMKMKERCCMDTQREAYEIVQNSAKKIFKGMESYDKEWAEQLVRDYGNGNKNRCQFPDYTCPPCKRQCRNSINIETGQMERQM